MMTLKQIIQLTILTNLMHFFTNPAACQNTYASRLGWKADERVIIFHIDDAGMSYESNQGTIQALQFGIATSCSVMQ
jgi:hypothetical protein